ncbi:hypothetical protein OAS39_13290 [Pirellulales bacterium]|nr:hypothetical protein [Pirellulales bacterium]
MRTLLVLITGFALVLALIICVRSFRVWYSNEVLRQRIASIRESGNPISFADLSGKPVQQEVDAASCLERAAEGLSAIFKELTAVRRSKQFRAGKASESDLTTIRSVLGTYAETMSLLEQAADCSIYHPQMEHSTDLSSPPAAHLHRIQCLRAATMALQARSVLQLTEGEPDNALETCVMMLRISRLAEKEPLMSGYLAALACRGAAIHSTNHVLQSVRISRNARDLLEAELKLHDNVAGYEWMLSTERVVGLETFHAHSASGNRSTQISQNQEQTTYLTTFDQQLRISSSTYKEFLDAYVEHRRILESAPLASQLFPAIQAAREATSRVQAETRCLRLLNVLQRDENQAKQNELDLTHLGLPPDTILDPFDGQHLHVKRLSGGWLIYSVGRNLKDDGGAIGPFLDVGVSPDLPLLSPLSKDKTN